jgi:hypothetical protein
MVKFVNLHKFHHSVMMLVCYFAFETVSGKRGNEESLSASTHRFNLPKPRISMSALNALNSLLPPHPTAWPTEFSMMFQSNFSSFSEAEHLDHSHAVKGHFSFSERNGLRISHGPGSRECQMSFHSNEGCSVQSHGNRMYVYYQTPRERVCCVDRSPAHALGSDWVTHDFRYNSTRRIMSRMCHGFRRERNIVHGFTYWADSVTKMPCAVSFDLQPRLDWYFIPKSLKLESNFLSPSWKDSPSCQNLCGESVTTSFSILSQ